MTWSIVACRKPCISLHLFYCFNVKILENTGISTYMYPSANNGLTNRLYTRKKKDKTLNPVAHTNR